MRRLIFFAFTQLLISQLAGQEKYSFHPPVKIPMYLSGNFGEIRTDHFHSGIDIKTQGSIGHHVFSIDQGYISRIKVQANGYGKSIYVTHPSGYTSVFGHLDRYRDDIAAYVKELQYARKSHRVDIYLDAKTFPLTKGEFIAYSGNTGGSSGPHLHFEIRKASNQHPTNVLKYGFDIEDQLAPRFHSVYIRALDEHSRINGSQKKFSSPMVKDNGIYTLPWGTKLQVSGDIGVSVEVFDYLNGASNRCGVYSLELYLDDQLQYRHLMDEFSFNETRYVNAHIDYEERIRDGTKAHRLHRLPNDRLRIYDHSGKGELRIHEDKSYQVRIVARDVAGNESELSFMISGDGTQETPGTLEEGPGRIMKYNEANHFEQDLVSVFIPKNALYQDISFSFETKPASQGTLSKFYQIGNEELAVHSPYTLSILSEETDPAIQEKLLIVMREQTGEISEAGGEYKNGKVSSDLKYFGEFAIGIDTIAPEIVPLRGMNKMSFTITDELSGIDKYEGYIDNRWVLFEYDMKNDLLVHVLDSEKITPNSEHDLELYVTDSKGNTSLHHAAFTW